MALTVRLQYGFPDRRSFQRRVNLRSSASAVLVESVTS